MSEEEKQEQQTEQTETTEQEGATEETGATSETETLTKEEIEKMIQSETDRRVTKFQQELQQVKQEKEELEKEKMSEEEKKQYELEKMQQQLSEKEQAIKERELALKTVDLLKEHGLPLDFAEFVKDPDEETTEDRVKQFKEMFQQKLQEQVEGRFKESGTDPQKRNKQTETFSKEQIKNMSPDEINANWEAISKKMEEGKL